MLGNSTQTTSTLLTNALNRTSRSLTHFKLSLSLTPLFNTMKEQERKEIIEALDFQRSQFSKDAPRLTELIQAMKKLNCERALDELTKLSIKELVRKCCEIVGYELTEANNASRLPVYVEKRRAVLYFIYQSHEYNSQVFTQVANEFGKDRTSMLHHAKRAEQMVESGDRVFAIHYGKLINHQFESLAA
jgi:hypothetical protein